MQQTRALLMRVVGVIDLAADFRIKDVAEWEKLVRHEGHAWPGLGGRGGIWSFPEVNGIKSSGADFWLPIRAVTDAVQLGFIPCSKPV